jgi:hypothetical protein
MLLDLASDEQIAAINAIDPLCSKDLLRSKMVDRAVANSQAYLMLEGEQLVGYAILTDHFFQRPFVEMLYVQEQRRRNGYGIEALRCLERIASAISNEIWTSTNQSNQGMRSILSKLGYQQVGSVDIDPGDLELFFRMELRRV